jgi:polar amino acid transport system substrate-binding protein
MEARAMKLAVLPTVALLILSAGCSSSVPNAFAPASPAPAACTELVLTGHPSYPPVAWADGSTLEGGGIDVVRRLARDNHIALRVVNEGTWDNAQLAVRSGSADAIVGIYRTAQRLAYFHYVSPPLAPDPSSVLIRTGETFHYVNWKSLIGKRGVVGTGESYGTAFDAFLAAKLTTYRVDTLNDIYQQLAEGKAEYGLSGYYAALTTAPKTIAIAAPDFVTEGLYLAFAKNSVCAKKLSAPFSTEIATLSSNGTIKKIFASELAIYIKTHPR